VQFHKSGDAVLHYQVVSAAPERPALVFINALGTDFRIWRDVIVRLVGQFSLLTYDMRGFGLSELGEGAMTIERHAADLAAIMDAAGLADAFVCGLSAGGQVAQQLAFDRPDRVRGLVLAGTLPKIADAAFWDARIAVLEQKGLEAVADSVVPRWFTEAFKAEQPEAYRGYRTMLARQPLAGYIALCQAVRDFDATDRASGLSTPTICIAGAEDKVTTPTAITDFARAIPRARLEIVPKAAHMLPVEQPETLSDIITAFADIVLREG